MRTIFGLSVLPPDSARVVIRAVKRAVALRHVSPNAPWQIIELWAADYLASVETERQQAIREAAEAANRAAPPEGEPMQRNGNEEGSIMAWVLGLIGGVLLGLLLGWSVTLPWYWFLPVLLGGSVLALAGLGLWLEDRREHKG